MRPDSILQEGTQEVGNLRLLQSQFGTGNLIDGTHPSIKPRPVKMSKLAHLVKSLGVNEPIAKKVTSINLSKNKPVLKPGSLSTPLRILSNSSLNNNNSSYSYNSILAKGPNFIQPLFIKFRSYKKVCIWYLVPTIRS